MSDAAILATFSDLKLIRGRKVAQLIFEVPIEDAQKATNALGFPDPAGEQWYGIARVSTGGQTPRHGAKGREEGLTPPVEPNPGPAVQGIGPGKGGAALGAAAPPKPNSTRAVMMAKDPEFWEYLRYSGLSVVESAEAAEAHLKFLCNVSSKKELNERGKAAEAFERLRRDFQSWRHVRAA